MKKEVGGQTYGYAWDGWNQIEDSLNGPNEVRNRRVYGFVLDNALRMDFDLNGNGGPDVQYVPVYDGIGNLVALTNAAGKPVERYEYSAYGKQRIFVDSTTPQINQIRKVGSTFFIEMSEEVSLVEIQRQIAEGQIKLTGTGVGGTYGLTATQPIQEGPLARRRIALTTGATIAANQEVTLTIGAETLVDSFLNAAPGTANVHTFDWEIEGILEDNTTPSVERIAVRAGRIEIDFDETVDATLAAQAITVDGGVVAWTRSASGYQMVADVALTAGSHEVGIGTGAIDLASKGLSIAVEHGVTVGMEAYASVFQAPNDWEVSASTANNPFGFHGLPIDPETGFHYVRNRYYDSELAIFASGDPLGYVDGPSAYSFVLQNPANRRDPMGLEGEKPGLNLFGINISLPWGGEGGKGNEPAREPAQNPDLGQVTVEDLANEAKKPETIETFAKCMIITGVLCLGAPVAAGELGPELAAVRASSRQGMPRAATLPRLRTARASEELAASRPTSSEPPPPRLSKPYGEQKTELKGSGQQAHHLNQDGAFRNQIPRKEGLSTPLRGNAITEPNSEHYSAPEILERFWQPYRSPKMAPPTNAEYGQALERSLRAGGKSPQVARQLAEEARQQRLAHGLLDTDPVPRVPGRMGQAAPGEVQR